MSLDVGQRRTPRDRLADHGLPRGVDWMLTVARFAPYHLLGAPVARHVVERNLLLWRGQVLTLASGVVEPLLYLLVLGVGVGGLVDADAISGATYGEFVAAGLLGAAAMNATVFETYNVFFKLRLDGLYEAMGATPAGPRDIAAGELVWAVGRVLLYSTGFMLVALSLGLLASPLAVLAIPVALLIGSAFGAVTLAATTYMRTWHDFDLLQIAIVPLFLFSATFYPLDVLPRWAQAVTVLSPLYHGIAALRQLMLGTIDAWLLLHVGLLAAMTAVGFSIAARRFQVLLRT